METETATSGSNVLHNAGTLWKMYSCSQIVRAMIDL